MFTLHRSGAASQKFNFISLEVHQRLLTYPRVVPQSLSYRGLNTHPANNLTTARKHIRENYRILSMNIINDFSINGPKNMYRRFAQSSIDSENSSECG